METEQMEQALTAAHIKGAIEAVQELLRMTLERRDLYADKADVTREILQDMYDGNALQNQGSYLLANQAVKYQAQSDAAHAASDEMEAVLEALATQQARPLVVAQGYDKGGAE